MKGSFSFNEVRNLAGFFDDKGILIMSYIAILTTGMAFGEKGLDERCPRTASVVCEDACTMGVMLKDDYDKILKEISSI